MEASKPSSLSAKNILLVLTHKKTDSFINRMKWTKTAWESFHPKNECIILVDITKDSSVQKVLNENGLKTIGYSKNLVSDEIKESVERNNIKYRGFDMILRFTRYHDFDYVWYIENDVKYDKKALENLWNNHKNVDDDLITWGVGGRGKKWWAWKRDTTDGDWAQAKEYTKGCLVMLCRFSKLLTHKMEEYMMRGNLTYIEIFVISLAKRENLKWSVWTKTDIGSLVPGPDITGKNVKLKKEKKDCRRPAENEDCGEQFWHPSVLMRRNMSTSIMSTSEYF